MNKTDLIQKIKLLEGISQDARSYLINLVNTKKKYGLVWEDKPEDHFFGIGFYALVNLMSIVFLNQI